MTMTMFDSTLLSFFAKSFTFDPRNWFSDIKLWRYFCGSREREHKISCVSVFVTCLSFGEITSVLLLVLWLSPLNLRVRLSADIARGTHLLLLQKVQHSHRKIRYSPVYKITLLTCLYYHCDISLSPLSFSLISGWQAVDISLPISLLRFPF